MEKNVWAFRCNSRMKTQSIFRLSDCSAAKAKEELAQKLRNRLAWLSTRKDDSVSRAIDGKTFPLPSLHFRGGSNFRNGIKLKSSAMEKHEWDGAKKKTIVFWSKRGLVFNIIRVGNNFCQRCYGEIQLKRSAMKKLEGIWIWAERSWKRVLWTKYGQEKRVEAAMFFPHALKSAENNSWTGLSVIIRAHGWGNGGGKLGYFDDFYINSCPRNIPSFRI